MMDCDQLKKQIRREIICKRNCLDDATMKAAGNELADVLVCDCVYKSSEYVLAYASFGTEIPTSPFIEAALKHEKKVYLPKVIGKNMHFYRIFSMSDTIEGFKGISEPAGDTEQYFYSEDLGSKTMILMPGVAFDDKGNRIGYGGGFYDRFLADKNILLKRSIAFGYDFQKVEMIPAMSYDLRPEKIVYLRTGKL